MKPARPIRCIALLLAGLAPVAAEIIDRIAVSVGNQVITVSEIERQIRVSAFLGGDKPDLSVAARRTAADRMVEQRLIRHELENSRYPLPKPADIDPVLAKFEKDQFQGEEGYRRALATYGITDQDVRDELLWQRTLLLFVEDRFRPGVQLSDADIQEYFNRVVAPEARAAHPGQPVALEDFRDQIQKTLTGERANEEMDRWLKAARGRTQVVYHPEAFQ